MTNIDVQNLKGKALNDKAAELGIEGRSKMKADELRTAILAKLNEQPEAKPESESEPSTVVPNRKALRARGFRNNTKKTIKVEGVKGLHYRGRATGAKHFKLMRDAQAASKGGRIVRSGTRTNFNESAPLPNSERVQKYARFNNIAGAITMGVRPQDAPKLTPKQMRRVRKNANKHNEGFLYSTSLLSGYKHMGTHSLLARTPEGMGIFHQFAK